jgi:hypothetical protein
MGVTDMNDLFAWLFVAAVILLLGYTDIADGIFDALDLSDNLKRAAEWARGVRGVPALVTMICFVVLAFGFGLLAYRYDILPTYRFVQPVAQDILATGAEWAARLVVVLTFVPTFIELATPKLAQRSIKMLEWMAYFFILFDLITDYNEASALVEVWRREGLFDQLPSFLADATVLMAKIGWTFAASFAFEFLCILFAITSILLFANVKATVAGGGAR